MTRWANRSRNLLRPKFIRTRQRRRLSSRSWQDRMIVRFRCCRTHRRPLHHDGAAAARLRHCLSVRRRPASRIVAIIPHIATRSATATGREHRRNRLLVGKSRREGLLEARVDDRVLATIFGHVLPGRIAAVWPPLLERPSNWQVARQIMSRLEDYLASENVRLMQSVLSDRNSAGRDNALGMRISVRIGSLLRLPAVGRCQ